MPKLIKHDSRAHALLSASGAERWMNCIPSARLTEHMKGTTSSYADEGTLAHELAEMKVSKLLNLVPIYEANRTLHDITKSEYYSEEMEDYTDAYAEYVLEKYIEASTGDPFAEVHIEAKVDLSTYIPDSFGTCDIIIISETQITVIDLKYGAGIPVSAIDNSQLKIYGLGALDRVDLVRDIKQINLCIHQPRLDNISEWSISADELVRWAIDYVRPRVDLAYEGAGDFNPGDWCRFCKARPRCKAVYDQVLTEAAREFADPALLTDEQVLEVFLKSTKLSSWLKRVDEYVYEKMSSSHPYKELKFVEGVSRRVVDDEKKIVSNLTKKGLKEDQIFNRKLKGFTEIKSFIGSAEFDNLIAPHLIKPKGKRLLVSADDPREPYSESTAKKDFSK